MSTIAIDIDDVLAANAEGFIAYSNQQWGTKLTVNDYDEHWLAMWNVDQAELERRGELLHTSGMMAEYRHDDQALPVLQRLRQNFRLIIVTSRRRLIEQLTRAWIDTHYPNIFEEIVFAGIYDDRSRSDLFARSKSDVFAAYEVDFVIDDQLKHCLGAAELGIEALLFGDYRWNQSVDHLPDTIHRVHDWAAVEKYFDERKTR